MKLTEHQLRATIRGILTELLGGKKKTSFLQDMLDVDPWGRGGGGYSGGGGGYYDDYYDDYDYSSYSTPSIKADVPLVDLESDIDIEVSGDEVGPMDLEEDGAAPVEETAGKVSIGVSGSPAKRLSSVSQTMGSE